jgi:hypothetical protein
MKAQDKLVKKKLFSAGPQKIKTKKRKIPKKKLLLFLILIKAKSPSRSKKKTKISYAYALADKKKISQVSKKKLKKNFLFYDEHIMHASRLFIEQANFICSKSSSSSVSCPAVSSGCSTGAPIADTLPFF